MKDQPAAVREPGECFIQHLIHLAVISPFTDGIADDLTIIQVKHRREIKFASKQGKLSHISYPFLIENIQFNLNAIDITMDFLETNVVAILRNAVTET